jgi:hypothetical protein
MLTTTATADDHRMKDRMRIMILLEGLRDHGAVSTAVDAVSGHAKRNRPPPGARRRVKLDGMDATVLAHCGEPADVISSRN